MQWLYESGPLFSIPSSEFSTRPWFLCLSSPVPSRHPSPTVQGLGDTVGGAQEDQRVLLVLGGHVSLHQQQPAVAARRTQRRRLLWLPGRGGAQRPEGSELHQPSEWQPV